MTSSPRRGYLVAPAGAPGGSGHDAPVPGPGVLVLHSWWGLTPGVRRFCDRLADAGFVALAPDLSFGELPADEAAASDALGAVDANVVADLVVSSAATLRSTHLTADAPVGVVGFSMGASWALWLASRQPHLVAAVAAFYGAQSVGFEHATAAFQLHLAGHDHLVTEDDLVLLEAALRMDGHDPEVHRYPGAGQWFMEDDRSDAYRPDDAAAAWDRTVAFLRRHVPIS